MSNFFETIQFQDDSWGREQIDAGEYLERLSVRQNAPSGFLSRIRNWVRLPGSSSSSSQEFHPDFEVATPPLQQGGPRQGRRGQR